MSRETFKRNTLVIKLETKWLTWWAESVPRLTSVCEESSCTAEAGSTQTRGSSRSATPVIFRWKPHSGKATLWVSTPSCPQMCEKAFTKIQSKGLKVSTNWNRLREKARMTEKTKCETSYDDYEAGIIQLNLNPEALLQTLLVSGPHPVSVLGSTFLYPLNLTVIGLSHQWCYCEGSVSYRSWFKQQIPKG